MNAHRDMSRQRDRSAEVDWLLDDIRQTNVLTERMRRDGASSGPWRHPAPAPERRAPSGWWIIPFSALGTALALIWWLA